MNANDSRQSPLPATFLLAAVEDSAAEARLLQCALAEITTPHVLTVVRDGAECLQLLEGAVRGTPDLLLLDINLPGLNGLDVLARIRANPTYGAIPVIMFSGSQRPEDVRRAYDLGANAYVVKPVTMDAYFEVVKAIESLWMRHVRYARPTNERAANAR